MYRPYKLVAVTSSVHLHTLHELDTDELWIHSTFFFGLISQTQKLITLINPLDVIKILGYLWTG